MTDFDWEDVSRNNIEEIKAELRKLNIKIPLTLKKSEMIQMLIEKSPEKPQLRRSQENSPLVPVVGEFSSPPCVRRSKRLSANACRLTGKKLSVRKIASRQQSPITRGCCSRKEQVSYGHILVLMLVVLIIFVVIFIINCV